MTMRESKAHLNLRKLDQKTRVLISISVNLLVLRTPSVSAVPKFSSKTCRQWRTIDMPGKNLEAFLDSNSDIDVGEETKLGIPPAKRHGQWAHILAEINDTRHLQHIPDMPDSSASPPRQTAFTFRLRC